MNFIAMLYWVMRRESTTPVWTISDGRLWKQAKAAQKAWEDGKNLR